MTSRPRLLFQAALLRMKQQQVVVVGRVDRRRGRALRVDARDDVRALRCVFVPTCGVDVELTTMDAPLTVHAHSVGVPTASA